MVVAGLFFQSPVARSEEYPSRPVTLVVGFPPGGGPDILARQLAAALNKQLHATFIVENRVGAIGTMGANSVVQAAPDGYTLLFGVASNLVIGPAVLRNPLYNPVKSFTPVVEIARGPYVLLVSSKLPAQSVAELVDYAKQNPGKLNFGSVGPGSPHHYAGELFKKAANIDIVHVAYKGGGPAYNAFLAGEIQVLFDSMPGPSAALQAGTIRALAVTGAKRLNVMPNVPTMAEAGYPKVDISFMFGVVAPQNTPRPIIEKLNAAITDALKEPAMREALARQSVEASPGTPEAFGALIASEYKRWNEIVELTGFRPD